MILLEDSGVFISLILSLNSFIEVIVAFMIGG